MHCTVLSCFAPVTGVQYIVPLMVVCTWPYKVQLGQHMPREWTKDTLRAGNNTLRVQWQSLTLCWSQVITDLLLNLYWCVVPEEASVATWPTTPHVTHAAGNFSCHARMQIDVPWSSTSTAYVLWRWSVWKPSLTEQLYNWPTTVALPLQLLAAHCKLWYIHSRHMLCTCKSVCFQHAHAALPARSMRLLWMCHNLQCVTQSCMHSAL